MSFTVTIPPRVGDAERAVAALLDVAGTQVFTGGEGRVGYGVEPVLAPLSREMPGRLVVRRRSGPFSGQTDHLDRVTSIELSIRGDVMSGMGDPAHYLSGLHLAVFNAIEGVSPEVVGAAILHPLRRVQTESATFKDDVEGFIFSRTLYKLILKAV